MRDFDDILTTLGFGKWNLNYFLGLSICGFIAPSFVFAGAFIAPNVAFECDTEAINESIINQNECTYTVSENTTGIELEQACSAWIYNKTDFSDTLTSEYDLVCDHTYLRPTYQTIYMVGNFIGSPSNGFLADRFGRKKLMIFSSILAVSSILITTVVPNFTYLLVFRFITGLTTSPLIQTGFILCMEVCEPKHRSAVGMILGVPWALGTMWWGFLGYMIRDWRWLMRATTIPSIILFASLWVMDESPRWSIVQGHHKNALRALRKGAKWNNATLPPDKELLKHMLAIQETSRRCSDLIEKSSKSSTSTFKDAFWKVAVLYRTPELRKRTLLMYFVFIVSSTVFYGLSLNAVNFQLNPYLYMVVGGVTEVPAYLLPIPLLTKFGKKNPAAIFYFVCGGTILLLAFIPPDPKWLIITLAMVGKFCISSAYQIIYLMASEVFPTEVRMQGLGTSSFVSTMGGFTAPFITEIVGNIYRWVPSLIFGVLSVLAGIDAIFIPETSKEHMPETVKQLEQTSKERKRLKAMKKKEVEVDLSDVTVKILDSPVI